MTKLQIEGKHISYSILELKKEDALYLQSIMENELVTYDKIFFERKDFKKLGYKKLENIPIVAHFSGFVADPPKFITPSGAFMLFRNKRKVFVSPLDRLEERYHIGLYKEFSEFKSTIGTYELSFRKRRAYKYFFLKEEQFGKFTSELSENIALNQFLFQHFYLFQPNSIFYRTQVVNVLFNDSKIDFKCVKKKGKSLKMECL
jgi:hypothetical protein